MKIKKDSKGRNLLLGEDQQTTGRYRYRYTDNYGTQGVLYSWKLVPTDKMPAGKRPDLSLREKEKQLQEALRQNVNIHNGTITMGELLDTFIDTKHNIRPGTVKNLRSICRSICSYPQFAEMKIKNIKALDINSYYRHLMYDNHLKYGSLKVYHSLIHAALDFAVANDFILKNPSQGVMSAFTDTKEEVMPLSVKEQQNLEDYLQHSRFPYKAMRMFIILLLHSGMRCGECCGLRWQDVDFDNRIIKVEGQICVKTSKEIYYAPTKNGVKRIIPMDDVAYESLKVLKDDQKYYERSIQSQVQKEKGFVFIHPNNNVYNPQSACIYITTYLNEKIKIYDSTMPYLHPHLMRHTFCTRLAEKGMDIKVLQSIMGHKSIKMTMDIYNHTSETRVQEEFNRVINVS